MSSRVRLGYSLKTSSIESPALRNSRIVRRRGGAKASTLPDFFIGAQAAVQQLPLLTRDTKRYKTYYPTVELTSPA